MVHGGCMVASDWHATVHAMLVHLGVLITRCTFALIGERLIHTNAHCLSTIAEVVSLESVALVNLHAFLVYLIEPIYHEAIVALTIVSEQVILASTIGATVIALAIVNVLALVLH